MKTVASFFLLALVNAQAGSPSFRAVEIDNKIEIGYGVAVADVDGDKKPDVLLADAKQIVWYQNPSWRKHVIAEKLTQRDHVCLAARDIDGDGKAEIAVGAEWNPGDTVNSGAVFSLMPGKDLTQPWEAIKLQHEPTTHRMRWMKNWQNEFELVVVPLHGRGNKGGQGEGVKILAYKMGMNPRDAWTTRTIDDALHMTHNFDPVQWDDDAAEEPLIASKEGVFIVNWEDGALKRTQLSGTESGGAGEVRMGRLASGKRFFATVEPMHGTNLVLYTEPKQSGRAKPPAEPLLWERRVLDSTLVDGHALACADLAGTGGDQIVVGWRAMGKPGAKVGIKMFTASDPDGKEWKSTFVDDNTMACEDLCVADLDANGKLDIIAAGRATRNVKIYFNGADGK
jgi:hypothetical protein